MAIRMMIKMNRIIIIIVLCIGLITLSIWTFRWYTDKVFQAGRDSYAAEVSKNNNDTQADLNRKNEDRLKTANEVNKKNKQEAETFIEGLPNGKVTNAEINSLNVGCSDIGLDFAKLYDKSIGERPYH